MRPQLLLAAFISITLAACEKEDKPYVLPPPGNVIKGQVHMGEDYETMVYFRFEDQQQSSANLADWDLAFETKNDHPLIRINGGNQVQVFNTYSSDFNQQYNVNTVGWQWDSPDGNPDSAAFRNWFDDANMKPFEFVYLIDRGPAASERYKKLQFQPAGTASYRLLFSDADGSHLRTFDILNDTAFNYMYFTFNDGGKLSSIEPGRNQYDVLFTRYRYIYYDLIPMLPYSVNGVLINPANTSVAQDSITPFDSIDYAFATGMQFSTAYDAIGFDWKTYNFDQSLYVVNPAKCYVLKNQLGVYYKLRFIDFYDENGIKGSPEFEFQRL